ncbi:MAG: ABC transporter ATP-binding protein [Spirochaetaceae bacterium]|nr:ABC transporter ATP-binding protein [Spirochaetaceae bacterium]
MYLLEVENLCKTFPTFSLKDVSFKIEEGYIMGFIGRNGAGKTTTLKSMLNFVKANKGTCVINGFDVSKDEIKVKESIGFVSGTDGFYQTTKIKTITNVTKKFFTNWNEELYKKLLSTFKLDENKKIKELSAGMKIKYQIALAMCHDAKLLILDEPTSGLDPVSRDELIMLFREYISDGKRSILFSTHITSDLEKCADFITYIKDGKIIKSTDICSFKDEYILVAGKKEDLSDELKNNLIGLYEHSFGFEGMLEKNKSELAKDLQIIQPSLEEIMVHIERQDSKLF